MTASVAVSDNFSALVQPVSAAQPLTVSRFIPGAKPGNVAVCLSGGGSRALTAGMGQLNALQHLGLLCEVKALSTVSGGSWLGVPFSYLPSSVRDTQFLGGTYLPPDCLTPASLAALPADCIAAQITSDFTLFDLLVQALYLWWEGAPPNMLWQTLIGLHLLAPYQLFVYTGGADTPDSYFTYDQTTWAAIVSANPSLEAETASLVSGEPRPYLVCNTALAVTANQQLLLAPVQATSFMTGVVSTPPGAVTADNLAVGGGGVTSFAFNSTPIGYDAATSQVALTQSRQWALVDIVGASSAAFAATLMTYAAQYADTPDPLAALLWERAPAARAFLARRGVRLTAAPAAVADALQAHALGDARRLESALSGIMSDLIPAYQYWPVAQVPVGSTITTTEFADGGSLENSGLAAMLAYGDISSLVAFANTMTPITMDNAGLIVVDDLIPPLFGYQPYVAGTGYVPYAGAVNPSNPLFQNNRVFPSTQFQSLLDGLWSASGGGTYEHPPLFLQSLTTVANEWFGIAGDRSVTVLWVYLERVRAWYDQLSPEVQDILGPFDDMRNGFPHYGTIFSTQLTPTEINLLANLTGWIVRSAQTQFQGLFQP